MSSPPNFFLDPNASFTMDGTGMIVRHKLEDQIPQSGPVAAFRYSAPSKPVSKAPIPTKPQPVPETTVEELVARNPRYPPSVNRHPVSPALLALLGIRKSEEPRPVEPKPENVPTAPPAAAWINPDVHAHTPEMRQLIKEEFPRLRDQTRLYATLFSSTVEEIRATYPDDVLIKQVMDKMVMREKAIDTDLFGVVPAGLLALVWNEYVKKIDERECYVLFKETLCDMGTTCIQGDSHRLLSILVALDRE